MAKRVTALSADAPTVRYVQPVHDRLFVEERPRGADNFKPYVRDSARGQARLLIDPTRLPGNDAHTSLDWWRPRPMRVSLCGARGIAAFNRGSPDRAAATAAIAVHAAVRNLQLPRAMNAG